MKKLLFFVLILLSQHLTAQTFTLQSDTIYANAYNCPASPGSVDSIINLTTGTLSINWKVDTCNFPIGWQYATGISDHSFIYTLSSLWGGTSASSPTQTVSTPPFVMMQFYPSTTTSLGTYWVRIKLTDASTLYTRYATFIISRPADTLMPETGVITGASMLCSGSSTTLANSVSGGTWSATNAHATVSSAGAVTGVSAGIDTIRYAQSNSCTTAYATKIITVNALPAPTVSTSGGALTTQSFYTSYQWYTGTATLVSGATSAAYSAPHSGNYYVSVTDTNGCTANSSPVNFIPVNVSNIQPGNITIAPNPAGNSVHVTNVPASAQYTIRSVTGSLVQQGNLSNATINIEGITGGIYILDITSDAGRNIIRFVKN